MSDICGRSGECRMGCDYAIWMCQGMNGNGDVHQSKGGMSHYGGRMRSVMCAPETAAAPVVVGMAS